MKYILLFFAMLASSASFAKINLRSFFSDKMVLQRNAEVNFWGCGNRGGQVLIIPAWSKDSIKVKATGYARFDAKLKTPEAGGPYEITVISGRNRRTIKNIL